MPLYKSFVRVVIIACKAYLSPVILLDCSLTRVSDIERKENLMAGRAPVIHTSYDKQKAVAVLSFNEGTTLAFSDIRRVFKALQKDGLFDADATIVLDDETGRILITVPHPVSVPGTRTKQFKSWFDGLALPVKTMITTMYTLRQAGKQRDTRELLSQVRAKLEAA